VSQNHYKNACLWYDKGLHDYLHLHSLVHKRHKKINLLHEQHSHFDSVGINTPNNVWNKAVASQMPAHQHLPSVLHMETNKEFNHTRMNSGITRGFTHEGKFGLRRPTRQHWKKSREGPFHVSWSKKKLDFATQYIRFCANLILHSKIPFHPDFSKLNFLKIG